MKTKYLLLQFVLLLVFSFKITAQTFVPSDIIIGNNFFQVEFSDDSKSMVWCEQIGTTPLAKVWYTSMNLDSGLPNLASKQVIDTIQGQGWPYWGRDNVSRFFVIKNKYGNIKYIRRGATSDVLTSYDLGTVNNDEKSLLNVSNDISKSYFWINYTKKSAIPTDKDSLFVFRSDNTSNRIFINAETKNSAGSAYELTFPRWLANSEILAYPFKPTVNPVFDMKFWNGATQTSQQVTNDITTNGYLYHHVDDLPFQLPEFPGETFMFSSRGANKLSIYQRNGQYFDLVQTHLPISTISPPTLTSFEPFTINTNKIYGAYQVYTGGIPGSTSGEIYLKGIFNDDLHIKISDYNGVTVDPEYVIGNNQVWIYYYGKPVSGINYFDLHRCATPLTISSLSTLEYTTDKLSVYPNPFTDKITIKNLDADEEYILINMFGQIIYSGTNIQEKDFIF
jgi:hypothetical protein